LPSEIQEYITSLAWRQHLRDLKPQNPLHDTLLREIQQHHALTAVFNIKFGYGYIEYWHKKCIFHCPNLSTLNMYMFQRCIYCTKCFGKTCCFSHSVIFGHYFHRGEHCRVRLGSNFNAAHSNI